MRINTQRGSRCNEDQDAPKNKMQRGSRWSGKHFSVQEILSEFLHCLLCLVIIFIIFIIVIIIILNRSSLQIYIQALQQLSNNKCTAHSTTSLEHKQNNNQMQQHMLERMHVPWMCYRNFFLLEIFVISSGGFSLLSWGNQRAEHQNPSLCRRSRCGHCKFHSVSSTHGSNQGPTLGQLRRKMIKMIFSENTHSVICIAKILIHTG